MTTQPYEFTKGSIFHLMEPDLNQEIYGLPEYLSAIPSALLNESATLFRRKYYINGSHAGFIMYMTDAAQNQEDVKQHPPCDEKCQRTRELPQPVYVLPQREKRRHPDHPIVRSSGKG
ncbi:putative phage portal protein [Klebsiella grimontii]|uniref:Putative phage portal protein n=1 Tax=Klebsiella grimontii TaxID=2058152 RepID=A0A7H4NYK2_9ENTR|nr:putative phage portal protein [Klebsiella grimontii]